MYLNPVDIFLLVHTVRFHNLTFFVLFSVLFVHVTYIVHYSSYRHESSVTSDPIQILEQTDDVVVVNKPSSIPVHPCGKYRHNTIVFILGKEHNLTNLRSMRIFRFYDKWLI